MNDFIVSAIKYRPATFQTVVGQPSITGTLKNAISQKHLAHAYLFCGPRGVGKTTCARIFAKTLNCSNLQENTEPCNECESCKAFNENRSYNIHELDAASNNKVDDIRLLIDQVRIPPQLGDYSVYIIDEVHMLSSSAFNAFLKTLEEPPKHAVFVLATTEKHKIIPTILSRCQIFDFNRIRVEDIVKHLQFVANSEGVNADADALNVIALKADGAMRDALSIFDQIVSFSGNHITYENTIENLNVLDYDYYFQLVDAMLENRGMDALLLYNSILENGFDSQYFLNGMATHLRDLLVSANPKSLILLEVGDSVKAKYQEQVKRCTAEYLFDALEILNTCDIEYRVSRNKRLLVELALLKLCNLSKKKITTDKVAVLPEVAQQTPQTPSQPKNPTPQKAVTTRTATENTVKKETPKQEIPQKTVTERSSSIPSISIRKGIAETPTSTATKQPKFAKTEEEKITKQELGEDNFTQEQATKVLQQYIAEKKVDERTRITLTAYSLETEGAEIHLKVSNALETALVGKIHKALEHFWQLHLNNKHIKLKLIEPKQEDRSIKAMGDKDKLQHLIQENKNILTLKQNLGLEFE
ncbi:MAG: DNA polymerase III subunit gamma/tau [Flavobacteriaceae bacterium]|nr:DNA polymerase III subunit gamma/tau [Flavobacteriaceae bacterium]